MGAGVLLALLVGGTISRPAASAPAARPSPAAVPASEAQSQAAFSDGQQLFKQGRWEDAVKALQRAVATHDGNAQAWYLLGLSQMQLRQWPQAERSLTAAGNLDTRNYNVWVQLGDCAASQGQFDRGREYVRRIFTFDQRSFYAHYALGVIDYREGRLANALGSFERSRSLYEEFAPTWYNLAVCGYNQHLVSIALQRIRRAVMLEPKKPLYAFLMGWYAMMSKDYSTGHLAFRNLFENDSKRSAYTDTARAFLAMMGNSPAEARTHLQQALEKDPAMTKALVLQALLQIRDGKKAEAIVALQRALETDPLDYDAREALVHLGVTPPPPGPALLPGQPSRVAPPQVAPGASAGGVPSATPSTAPSGTVPPIPTPSSAPSPKPEVTAPPPPGVPRR